jgi:hypothetical protein
MDQKKKTNKMVGSRWNQDELPILEWLSKETSRTPSGAIKWAVAKVAKELGYKSEKRR